MKMRQHAATRWIAVLVPMILLAQVAFAHPQSGEAKGFLTGFRHPISGLDHVLAMVAVGLWGAQLGSPAIWVLPVAFPMVMAMGGMLGLMGVPLPGTEIAIAASAILFQSGGRHFRLQSSAPLGRLAGCLLRHLPWACSRYRVAARAEQLAL